MIALYVTLLLRYPFIHLGGEEQMWDKFLAQGNSSGQGGIRTRDLSIPKPASYHKTTASTKITCSYV
ncbi:hypothetical protein DPMN_110288 [Dreissena polymorpha]|uniref:Uncharacterized protein n=1 Tax=Dreissena polymorpha TaxID=45954 RepID=A0A9D4QNR3_DREPO|nr:hypothetical protein DPMN_110288 [Dreissena polymorpha]